MDKLANFLNRYNLNLTDQQREAIEDINGPSLILAVPGSGKTTTLVARTGYMIYEHNINPENILVMTYTVAASKDMCQRFKKVFGDEYADTIKFSTINSICASIIWRYNPNAFTLVENNRDLIRQSFLEAEAPFPEEYDIKQMQQAITYIKNMQLTDEQIDEKYPEENNYNVKNIYHIYQDKLLLRREMDFDDQLVYAYKILRKNPDILSYYQRQYPYILVDEAQDTSKIQHYIIRLLAGKNENIFMVGDEDQSIYGFRGAYPQALMEFKDFYPRAQIHKLEINFRSTPQIVFPANRFIDKNKNRYKKNMTTLNPKGENPKYTRGMRSSQYKRIKYIAQNPLPGETAILYRNNDSAVPIIYNMAKEDIPCFWKEKDNIFFKAPTTLMVRDFMKLTIDPLDTEVFLKSYFKFGLKMRKSVALDIVNKCSRGYCNSVFDGLVDAAPSGKQFKNYLQVRRDFTTPNATAAQLLEIFHSSYNYYKDNDRFIILKQLAEPHESPAEFLSKLDRLEVYINQGSPYKKSNLILSTIHSSKGLEYDNVVIIDVNEGIFSMDTRNDDPKYKETLEEDRRLFYVACTRAKKNLELIETSYSPFIQDFLGLKTTRSKGSKKASNNAKSFTASRTMLDSNAPVKHDFKVGDTVSHKTFGKGKIINIDGDYLDIRFKDQMKKLSIKSCINFNLLVKL